MGEVTADITAAHAVSWDSHNRLEFALPFQDIKASIHFGESVLLCGCDDHAHF